MVGTQCLIILFGCFRKSNLKHKDRFIITLLLLVKMSSQKQELWTLVGGVTKDIAYRIGWYILFRGGGCDSHGHSRRARFPIILTFGPNFLCRRIGLGWIRGIQTHYSRWNIGSSNRFN